MKNLDLIFIHPPVNFQYLDKQSRFRSSFISLPMGVFALADLLEREGFGVKIINYPLEFIVHSNFSLINELKKNSFKVIAVDLHWILHSYGALEILRVVKKWFPTCFTLLGGYSASFFAREILRSYDYVDGIIRGEAESPIVELLRNLNSLENVPNLMYRKNGEIKENPISYVATEIDSLNFSRIKHLEHWKEYLEYMERYMGIRWPVEMARGCPYNCIFCGGGRTSSKILSNRDKAIFRSPQRIFDDIKYIVDLAKIDRIFYGHGVYKSTEKYFMETNRLIREEGLELGAEFEVWRLPVSQAFLKDFTKTYPGKNQVMFSVRMFSESQRRRLSRILGPKDSSFNFTNAQLRGFLKSLNEYRIPALLFWDVGYPHENPLDILKNSFHALKILKYHASLLMEPMLVSPGSPVFLYHKELGLKLEVQTFQAYYEMMKTAMLGLNPLDRQMTFRTRFLSPIRMKWTIALLSIINMLSFLTELE